MAPTDDQIRELHATVCKALAHPARLRVLDHLRAGEECVCRLAPQVGVSEAHLSQLLAVLRRVGVVQSRREGHQVFYRVRDDRIFDVIDRMRAMLADQLSGAQHLALQV